MRDPKHETIADIVAAMRNESHAGDASCLEWVGAKMRSYADRIEAAAKREREAGAEVTISEHVSNAAAMREALDAITRIDTIMLKRLLCELVEADIFDGGQIRNTIHAVEKARQALSAPPRNCDVGTAEEQHERHNKWCAHKTMGYCWGRGCRKCIAEWEHMPYEEGGASGSRSVPASTASTGTRTERRMANERKSETSRLL